MLKKGLLAAIAMVLAGDAFIFHGHYRAQMAREAEIAKHTVENQKWAGPLVETGR